MCVQTGTESIKDCELVLTRVMNVPREKLFRAWTEPEIMKRWFTPAPWKTVEVRNDLRAGGESFVRMQGPDGEDMPCPGVYLEVVKNEKLVFTDAFVRAWEPSNKPFMVAVITFEDLGGGRTRYTARVQHWTIADRETHEKMGFHEGWGVTTDQLEQVAATL